MTLLVRLVAQHRNSNEIAAATGSSHRAVGKQLLKANGLLGVANQFDAARLLADREAGVERLSPARAQRTLKATVSALSALIEGQEQMPMRGHPSIEKVGRQLGLTETSWGENLPRPSGAILEKRELQHG